MANCALPFWKVVLRRAPGCQHPEILPASMNSPGVQSSVFWSVYKPRDISPPVSGSVRGSIVLRRLVRPAKQPRHRHIFVASFRYINSRNPGSTWRLLTGSALFGSGFQPSTNSRPRFGDVLPQAERVISDHG